MSQKLRFQLLLGFVLSSVYLTTFFLTVERQRASHLSLAQAHPPHRYVTLSAEEINGRTLKAAAALDRSHRRY